MPTSAPGPTAQQRFGARIRDLRHERGWSQETLAERAGLHPKYPSHVERGTRDVRLTTILALAAALDVDPTLLVADLTSVAPSASPH